MLAYCAIFPAHTGDAVKPCLRGRASNLGWEGVSRPVDVWRDVDGDDCHTGRTVFQSVLFLVGKVSRRCGHRVKGLEIDRCALNAL